MKLNFVIHDVSRDKPYGGLKQQYELANRLSRRGHDVAVYHSLNFGPNVAARPRSVAGLVRHNVRGRKTIGWFALDPSIRCRYLPRIYPRLLRPADTTIISSSRVAERIPCRTARTGRLVYVVYEFPVWQYGRPDLKARLAEQLARPEIDYIASSLATHAMLESLGVRAIAKVPCGIDVPPIDELPPTGKRAPIIGFALRPERYKGAADVMAAIPLVRNRHPQARFECFGRYREGVPLPCGLENHGFLDDERLSDFYRRCLIFVSASHAEGWGLTAAEAMARGAAVVVTTDGGSRDFAIDGETALVVPPRDPNAIASAVCRLLEDERLRMRIAAGGIRRSRQMTWEATVERFESLLGGGLTPTASHRSSGEVRPT